MPIPLIIACAAGIALLSSCGVIGGRDSDDNNVDPADDDTGIDPPDDTGDDDTGDPLPGPDYDKDGDGYVDGSLPSEDLQALVADGTVTADQILPQNLDCDDTHFFTNPGMEMEYMGSRDNNCDGSKSLVLSRDTVELVPSYDGVKAGYGALAMGDVDGDGIDDALIGSPNEGGAYLVFGPINPGDSTSEMIDRAEVYFSGVEESGIAGSTLGKSVAIKNLDGDTDGAVAGKGLGEVIIGAPGFNQYGLEQYGIGNGTDSGGILVLHGRSRSEWESDDAAGKFDLTYDVLESSSQIASRDAAFLVHTAGENALLGQHLAVSDDIDGDDIPDILSNAGTNDAMSTPALNPDTGALWSGLVDGNLKAHEWEAGQFGLLGDHPIAVGDFNGDGLMDPVFGDTNANDGRGAVYVFLGDENLPSLVTISDTDVDTPTDNFVFTGHEEGFAAGGAFVTADFLKSDTADVDGDGNRTEMVAGQDGLDELVAGVGGEDVDPYDNNGAVYTIPGAGIASMSSGEVRYFNGDVMELGGVAYYADENSAAMGSLSLAATSEGILLASHLYGSQNQGFVGFVGSTELVSHEGTTTAVGSDESTYDFLSLLTGQVTDGASDYRLGTTVAAGGDLNNDGAEDFLINDADREGGTVYVAFGEPPNPAQ